MAGIEFDVVITKQAVDYARVVEGGAGKGWHLTPKRFAVSSEQGDLKNTRDLASMRQTWHDGSFSTVVPTGANQIINNITIPANTRTTPIEIKEIYFIYENHTNENDDEFLFALAQPRSEITFIPGVTSSFKFIFAINELHDVESIIDVSYTYPEEISDHSLDLNSHPNLVARDGSRTLGNESANQFIQYVPYKEYYKKDSEGHIIIDPETGLPIIESTEGYKNDAFDSDDVSDSTVVTKGYVILKVSDAEAKAKKYTDDEIAKISRQDIKVYYN